MQLVELDAQGGARTITALAEPVRAARYVTGQRRAVIEVDTGGNELGQLYVVGLDGPPGSAPLGAHELDALTDDPRHAHHLAGVSPDGSTVAFLSTRRNGVDFDLWTIDLASRSLRCHYDGGGYCMPASGFSPDGRWISFLRPGNRPLDMNLLLVDTHTGEPRVIFEHADESAEVGSPVWDTPTSFYVASNVGRDFQAVVHHDLESGASRTVEGTGETCDAAPVFATPQMLSMVENVNGASRWTLRATGSAPVEISLPEPGVVHWDEMFTPKFTSSGSRAYFTFLSPRHPGDVWALDAARACRRLTDSALGMPADSFVAAESSVATSFDGEELALYCYRPAGVERPAVVVVIHGGPESQSRLVFNPVIQGLLAAGLAVVVPNVRGSTGYGKRFAALDDTVRRLDSVRDLESVHEWIAANGLDEDRVALYGGSYGGYMVLAGLAFQPSRWAAGVDIVGISNLVTFLENTSAYRRTLREHEYGSLEHDRDFLAAASPMTRVDDIVAPLFVVHGRNDPRVPVSEAEQLASRLVERGVRCELVIYEDEGHGLARLENRLDATPRIVDFLLEVLAE